MKKVLFILLFTGTFVFGRSQSADPYILIDVQPGIVKLNQSSNLYVNVCNLGGSSIVSNSIVVRITAGVNAEIIGFSSVNSSDSRFTINTATSTTGNGNVIELTNSGGTLTDLGGANPCADINLEIKGKVISSATDLTGVVSYIDGPNPLLSGAESITQGDVTGNNTSNSSLGVSNLLPIHLANFTATKSGGYSLLSWQYDNAINFSHFELERSADGIHFSNLTNKQYKPANTQAGSVATFKETDLLPLNGANYYRLKMVDIDGFYSYSKIVKLDFTQAATGMNIYPNPARDQVTIETAGNLRTGQLKVYNANGAVVFKTSVATATTRVATAGFSAGVYLVELLDAQGNRIGTRRFVKIK